MKKVLQISKYYYPFLGGIEQVARDMARVFGNMNDVEQKIICFNEDATDGEFICNKKKTVTEFVEGVEVIRCGYEMKIASQSMSFSYSKELKRVINEFKPDIIILHYPNPFVTHYLLKYSNCDFKLWIYWHLDITKQKVLKRFFHGQNIRLINRADLILGATPKHIEESEYTSYFGNKTSVLPYTIDEESLVVSENEIVEAKRIRNKHQGEIIGFFIGRHVPYKGLEYLIEASEKLGKEKIHFFIAGTGELTAELKEKARDDKKIEFIGRITESERRAYLSACDIICFPSITRNEAFGLALAEGMYFAKPAVTFTIQGSGVNFVNINGETGIECPNCDSDAYAAALRKLINDSKLRMELGLNARNRIMSNFTMNRFSINIENLMKQID